MSPQRDNLVVSGPLPAQWIQHLQNRPCPQGSRPGNICDLLIRGLAGQAALCCFVPWLVWTLLLEKGQELLSSWSGSHLMPQ